MGGAVAHEASREEVGALDGRIKGLALPMRLVRVGRERKGEHTAKIKRAGIVL
jgi:hypothetical protein